VANASYLAFGLDAEHPPLKFRAWQVDEYVCNKSANVRLRRERIKRVTVQASSDVAALEIQAKRTISASQYARRDALDDRAGHIRDKYEVRVRTSEENGIWQFQLLQLVMNGLLKGKNTLGVLAIRAVTKLGGHE